MKIAFDLDLTDEQLADLQREVEQQQSHDPDLTVEAFVTRLAMKPIYGWFEQAAAEQRRRSLAAPEVKLVARAFAEADAVTQDAILARLGVSKVVSADVIVKQPPVER